MPLWEIPGKVGENDKGWKVVTLGKQITDIFTYQMSQYHMEMSKTIHPADEKTNKKCHKCQLLQTQMLQTNGNSTYIRHVQRPAGLFQTKSIKRY